MLLKDAKKVLVIGNGGSYANASHIVNDLLTAGVRAFTLDPATLTAWANDYGWEGVFARWIETVGEKGDLVLALSGSGRSPNILRALEKAKEKGIATQAVFGAYNDHDPVADTMSLGGDDMQQAEEHQLVWGHEMRRVLK